MSDPFRERIGDHEMRISTDEETGLTALTLFYQDELVLHRVITIEQMEQFASRITEEARHREGHEKLDVVKIADEVFDK